MFSPDYEKRLLKHCSPVAKKLFSSLETASTSTSEDRFIPCRANNNWGTYFTSDNKLNEDSTNKIQNKKKIVKSIYSCVLKNELLGTTIDNVKFVKDEANGVDSFKSPNETLFKYQLVNKKDLNEHSPYCLSPIGIKSQKLLQSPSKVVRKISTVPYKVLDAPELQDDFYLNLVDWSSQNILAVGLNSAVYLWSAYTTNVTRLCDLSSVSNAVTSVSWNGCGNLLAVGTHCGYILLWDVTSNKQIGKIRGHLARVGALAWNNDILCSGSRDRRIIQRDTRTPTQQSERCLISHRQEVCGVKYSANMQYLASGGNDNRLHVWNQHSLKPVHTFTKHKAAVKAIAWSPHQHELLISGGGTFDHCIRFWNSLTGQPLQCVDTDSQVCNLAWSNYSPEFVSTHGYSQNQILVWKYPSLKQITKLTGHSYRVLYLAVGPDGESIVTGAGDETLRFWKVFDKHQSQKTNKSILNLYTNIR